MPIYEYRCESCAEHVEKLQKISDAPLKDCPACGKAALKKLVSASSFRLKGSGWYETDFKNKKKPTSTADESDKASGGKEEGKSDKDGKESNQGKDAKTRGSDKSGGKEGTARKTGAD